MTENRLRFQDIGLINPDLSDKLAGGEAEPGCMTGLADKLRHAFQKLAGAASELRPKGNGEKKSAARNGPRWAEQEPQIFERPEPAAPAVNPVARPEKAFVTPFYFWGTLALLMTGFAVAVMVVQFRSGVGDTENERTVVYEDPLSALDAPVREVLLNPTPELAARLKRSFLGKPDQLCAELKAIGLENPGWRKAPFQRNRWQCASELLSITTPSVDFGATTLFFLLRGPSESKIDYLRLKLVVEDARQKELGLEAVWLVINALAGRYGWTVPDEFRAAISDFRQLETMHLGVRLSVAPEDPNLTGDPLAGQRLNIIMDFGEPDLIRPADSFEKAPPLESGWGITDQDGPEGE